MDAKVQRWVQRNGWDRAVDDYEACWRQQLRPAHDAVLGAAELVAGERVIDVACGTGMVTLPAARAVGPTGAVLATDLSPRMVDDVARRAREQRLDHVDVCRADAEDLGPVGPFDVALCSLGLMYVPAPDVAMRELARVLRPGGRAVVAVWGERRRCGWAGVFPIVDARVSSDVCPLFFALGGRGALVALAERAGFADVVEHRFETDLVYVDEAAAIGAAFLGGPVALAHSRFDEATRTSAYRAYLDSIAPFRSGRGYRVPGEFVIVAGHVPAVPAACSSDATEHHHRDHHHTTTTTTTTTTTARSHDMTTTATPVDNGVNTAALLGARDALTAAPEAAEFTWRATTSWVNGTHSRSTIDTFSGLGQQHTHRSTFVIDGDHPECFASEDRGATPAELALVALGGCLTAGVAAVAQHRNIQLRKVTATVEGDMNVLGILGADPEIRNGYRAIRVRFDIDADATPEEIRALVAQSQKRSAVFDVITNPTDVVVEVA